MAQFQRNYVQVGRRSDSKSNLAEDTKYNTGNSPNVQANHPCLDKFIPYWY